MNESIEIPSALDQAEFREAWAEFLAHRSEIRKPLTPRAQRMQLRKLTRWGAARAIAAIEHSVGNGYVGIFEDPSSKPSPSTGSGQSPKAKPMSLWEIKERKKALLNELESLNSRYCGPDADRVNADRAEKRAKIRAKLKQLKAAELDF